MLLITGKCILTTINTLTVLRSIRLHRSFQSQLQWQYKANIWHELPILSLKLLYI